MPFSIANLVLSVAIVLISFRYWLHIRKYYEWTWLILLTGIIAVGWALLYAYKIYEIFYPALGHNLETIALIGNPLLTLTLTMTIANLLVGRKRHEHNPQ